MIVAIGHAVGDLTRGDRDFWTLIVSFGTPLHIKIFPN
jgi:hypothetical protein